MTPPRATYRLQLHAGCTLRQARQLVPYLAALGVSHLYASPLLRARPGSPHGYDVCDPSRLNPDLGTEADLETLVAALHQHAMGLVLDIVPNHLAAAPDNPWWWDLLKHGPHSRFAPYFDVDWEPPDPALHGKILLPVLAHDYPRVLERGELTVACEHADIVVRYGDHRFPVSPESLRVPSPSIEDAVARCNTDPQALHAFLMRQHYLLAHWRLADAHLNYRRFFTVSDLAGVRVELPQVFADTHNHLLDWHQRGLVDGFRVDHPDGLRDPLDYLHRLHHAAPNAWIVVEKILESQEHLPADWPVAGTTGYEFLNRVNGLFIDPAGERPLTDLYARFTAEPTDYPALQRETKHLVLRHGFHTEVSRLVRLLAALPTRSPVGSPAWREAIETWVAAFPVYRTYLQAGPQPPAHPSPQELQAIRRAFADARRHRPDLAIPLRFLRDLFHRHPTGPAFDEVLLRLQQLTGPAMAKGVEDTAAYRFNRCLALNEVGGNPARFGTPVAAFHRANSWTATHAPHSLLATSTHDTKRSEDVRARLVLLSEIPDRWAAAVQRWATLNAPSRTANAPDRNLEYLYYQTLVGAWPLPQDRALAYLLKAAREAKQHTDWSAPHPAYEAALEHFVTTTLANPRFVADLDHFVDSLTPASHVNALAQSLLKLTAPGIPDLYQGTELWDLSLVDPDNRRPVDFAARQRALAALPPPNPAKAGTIDLDALRRTEDDGHIKLWVIRQSLHARLRHPQLYRQGHYLPLRATGSRRRYVCAFARTWKHHATLTVVPRLVFGLTHGRGDWPLGADTWGNTRLLLPRALAHRAFRNLLTGATLPAPAPHRSPALPLAQILHHCPVALLESLPARTHHPAP